MITVLIIIDTNSRILCIQFIIKYIETNSNKNM